MASIDRSKRPSKLLPMSSFETAHQMSAGYNGKSHHDKASCSARPIWNATQLECHAVGMAYI